MVNSRLDLHLLSVVKPWSFQKECLQSFRFSCFLGAKCGQISSRTIILILRILLYIFSLRIILRGLFWNLISGWKTFFLPFFFFILMGFVGYNFFKKTCLLLISRSQGNIACLIELMEVQSSMMRSCIDGVELLIFTSKQLHMDSQGELSGIHNIWFSYIFIYFFVVASAFPIDEYTKDNCLGFLIFFGRDYCD